MQHTPAPWRLSRKSALFLPCINGADGSLVAVAQGQQSEANGRLICAAPDMLAALQEIDTDWSSYFRGGPDGEEQASGIHMGDAHRAFWRKARAAIAKAVNG